MRMRPVLAAALLAALLPAVPGCGDSPSEPVPGYDELVTTGWDAYVRGFYDVSFQRFENAIALESGSGRAYAGSGWSLLKLDQRDEAAARFAAGASQEGATADLFAGWAYLLAAMDAQAESNAMATRALELDPEWTFIGGSGTDKIDLRLLLATNHFILGEFEASLAEVRMVDPDFDADVDTSDGRTALAARIEVLTGIHRARWVP